MKETTKKFWKDHWFDVVALGLKAIGYGGMIFAAYKGAEAGVSGMHTHLNVDVNLDKKLIHHAHGTIQMNNKPMSLEAENYEIVIDDDEEEEEQE